ncbi:MAG: helix-turn-helix domain-containing protein [Paludibacter sp.]
MNQPDLGRKIAELRKAKGLTQDELVEKCNISVRTLQRIEAGEVSPRSYTLKIIFAALDYDIYDSHENTSGKLDKILFIVSKWLGQLYKYLIDLFNLKTNKMKKITVLSSAVLVVGFVLFSVCTESHAQTKANVTKIIEKSNKEYIRWFNDGKIDSIMTQYRDDACLVAKGCGKSFIHDYLSSESRRYRFKELSILSISISDSIAVEKGRWVVSLYSGGDFEGEYLTEWHLSKGKWLMVNGISDSK